MNALEKNTHTAARRERILARRIPKGSRIVPPSARNARKAAAQFDRRVRAVSREISAVVDQCRDPEVARWSLAWLYAHARTPEQVDRVKVLAAWRTNARKGIA